MKYLNYKLVRGEERMVIVGTTKDHNYSIRECESAYIVNYQTDKSSGVRTINPRGISVYVRRQGWTMLDPDGNVFDMPRIPRLKGISTAQEVTLPPIKKESMIKRFFKALLGLK